MPIPPAPAKYTPKMPTRIAPAPIGSGVSVRKLPVASVDQLHAVTEHWLAKSGGDYGHPATRHMFEMGYELQALIEPIRAEEARKDARLFHLEEIMAQWNEVIRAFLIFSAACRARWEGLHVCASCVLLASRISLCC